MSALPEDAKSAARKLVDSRLTTLYERYHAEVYLYCRSRLRDPDEAEDATQVTFVKAYAALRRGVIPETETAWLFTIAKRVVLSRLDVTQRLRAVEATADVDDVEAPAVFDASALDELRAAVEALPENSRRAFVMREWQGMEYGEIADELGVGRSHVGVMLLRARRRITGQR